MRNLKKDLLGAMLAMPLLAAADYPAGPVKLVHAYPGGLVDTGARALAEVLAARWNQPAVVDSSPAPTNCWLATPSPRRRATARRCWWPPKRR